MIDVLIVPSLWPESFGLVAREASLLGVWVVVSDSGGLPDAVIDNDTGFVFKTGDKDDLTRVLTELDENWLRYKEPVADASLAKLKIRSVSQQIREVNEMYQEILTRN